MRARLARLGVEGVEARTFHSAALAQLRRARGEGPGRILSTKALLLRQIGNTLPPPYRFRPAGDLATEIEWAKNRRLTPQTYRDGLGVARAADPGGPDGDASSASTSGARRRSGAIDFEDLLELAIRMYEEDEHALAALRERYSAFTVDEYQDVNLLQQTLLDLWLGAARRRSARSATTTSRSTASPAPRRSGCSGCRRGSRRRRSCGWRRTTARRRRCSSSRTGSCRSSAAPRRRCAPRGPTGPSPSCAASTRGEAEGAFVRRAGPRAGEGVPYEEMAVLCRHERALGRLRGAVRRRAGPVPGRVAAGARRRAAAARGLRGAGFGSLAEEVRRLAVQQGLRRSASRTRLGERELVAPGRPRAARASWPRSSTTARDGRAVDRVAAPRFARGAPGAASTC